MDLDPRRLLLLQAISETNSLAQAARRLGHTPSAVSQQLAKLEREAGTALVDRGVGGVALTEAGRILARAGGRIGDSLADAERELLALTGSATGPITIAMPPGETVEVVAGAVALLAERHPDLRPILVEAEQAEGLRMLRTQSVDVAIVIDDRDTAVPLPPGYVSQVLMEDEYRIAIPSGWELPATPADLSGRPWIGAPPASARGRCFRRLADLHGIVPAGEHIAVSLSTLQTMAAAGLGACIAPWYYADWLRNCTVLDLPVPGGFIARVIRRGTPAAEAVRDAVSESARTRAEQLVERGIHKRDIRIKRLPDPGDAAETE